MFDLSWSHIFILLVVALVVVGPKDLPRLMRTLGQWMGKARSMADQFRKSFDDMARQAELDDLRKEIESLRTDRPLAGLAQDMHQSIVPEDMRGSPLAPPPQSVAIEAEPVAAPPPPEPPHDIPDPGTLLNEPVAAGDVHPPVP
ncbi:MAG TPA: Sec-independent protein translocase protein TatB [Rhizomicrobium sp.]|nr:Sec-independent protein translocase protein TatB [Rhizomicrobium sp.]